MRTLLLAVLAAGCAAPGTDPGRAPVDPSTGWPLVAAPDFSDGAGFWSFAHTDVAAWRLAVRGGRPTLELFGASDYAPPHRSPRSLAVLRTPAVGDFALEVDVQSTAREYGHRDLCLVLGWTAPDRFAYVHLASAPDERAHNVFLVDRADRRPLAPVAGAGVDWGAEAWHRVRLERRAGRVTVDFDGRRVLEAEAPALPRGRVGLGSFDDTGRFADLRVWSPDADAPDAPVGLGRAPQEARACSSRSIAASRSAT